MLSASNSLLSKPEVQQLLYIRPVLRHRAKTLTARKNSCYKTRAGKTLTESRQDMLEGLAEDTDIDIADLYSQFDTMLESLPTAFNVGDRVKGTVYTVDEVSAYIDFGGKELGVCPTYETTVAKVSKAYEVLREDTEYEFEIVATGINKKALGGMVSYLSRRKIEVELTRQRLKVLCENEFPIKVLVTGKNRGGYECETEEGLRSFIPATQANINPGSMTSETDELIGKKVDVKIMQVDDGEDGNIILSERMAFTDKNSSEFKVGSVVTGFVTGIKPYGVFVDVHRFQGLLHITQITHVRISSAESVFSIGDKVKVMILSFDKERRRLSLSTKKLEANPGDMLKDPNMVYEGAEDMAAKFREQVALAEASIKEEEERMAAQANVAFDE